MFLSKIQSVFKSFRSIRNQFTFIHTYIYKMDKAYMRCPQGSDVFELTFQYCNPELRVNRKFNFSRKLTENVNTFLTRVSINVDKIVNKKLKKNKSKENVVNVNPEISEVNLYRNGVKVDPETICSELFETGGDIRLKLLNNEYQVVINTPWILNITLPTSLLTKFSVYPSKLETQFTDLELSEFNWYKSSDQIEWISIGTGFIYTPDSSDINSYLKLVCTPKNSDNSGPETEVISSEKIQADPGECPFDIRHQFTKEKLKGNNFRITTYNLLADLYTDSDYSRTVLFPYCPPYALQIDYRKQLILRELIGYNSDIICLQEVDDKVFENDLNPVLSKKSSLTGIYSKKGGTLREGLATFYNSKRFNLISSDTKILAEELDTNPLYEDLWAKISQNEKLAKRLTDRTTILQITALDSIENKNDIVLVANTHFYFHPDADHIRLLQAGIASVYIEDYFKQLQIKSKKHVSLIFCGDFNSVPECGVYKLFTTGNVPEEYIDWISNVSEMVEGLALQHERLMTSAYGTPPYTNYTPGFKDCLDYIFYENGKFEVLQVVPLPSEEELNAHIAIPSVVVPSDHLALITDLKLLTH